MSSYTLDDVEAVNRGHPTETVTRKVRAGSVVKLMFVPAPPDRGIPEAMWVTVTAVSNGTYTGTLASHPGPGKGLPAFGDVVTFEGKHIITAMGC
jgi:uncharacterized protein YegJ (DUF2314 family)